MIEMLRALVSLELLLIGCMSTSGRAERMLMCSSSSVRVWYEYTGPVSYFQLNMQTCTNGMRVMNFNYTLIPKFTIHWVGYDISTSYRKRQWLEFHQTPVPCSHISVCNLIKGERISESVTLPLKQYIAPEGEYQLNTRLIIIDDWENEHIINVNVTVQILNDNN